MRESHNFYCKVCGIDHRGLVLQEETVCNSTSGKCAEASGGGDKTSSRCVDDRGSGTGDKTSGQVTGTTGTEIDTGTGVESHPTGQKTGTTTGL